MSDAEPVILASTGVHENPELGNRYWLARSAQITLDASTCIAAMASDVACLQLTLVAGPEELYQRFPFNVEVGLEGKVVKILEFTHGEQEKIVKLPIGETGVVSFAVVSEVAYVPAELDLGPDERELSLKVSFAAVPDLPDVTAGSAAMPFRPWVPSVLPVCGEPPRPVFVVGMYRSGTSILTWALGQHPNLWALEETGWLPPLGNAILAAWQRARGAPRQRSFSKVYEISEAQFLAHFAGSIDDLMQKVSREHAVRVLLSRAGGYAPSFTPELQILRALGSSKQRWVDGTPENVMCAGQLHTLFPSAKFIHLVRHPVEVVASMMHFERAGGAPATAEAALALWRERVTMACLAERAFGSAIVMRMAYEDLIARPDERLRDLFTFLAEPDFDTAAATFNVRINSSLVAPEELDEARHSLGSDQLDQAMRLYQEAGAPLSSPLSPDPGAQAEINEIMGDLTTRLLAEF